MQKPQDAPLPPLAELLSLLNITPTEFSRRTGIPIVQVACVLRGQSHHELDVLTKIDAVSDARWRSVVQQWRVQKTPPNGPSRIGALADGHAAQPIVSSRA